MNFSKAVITAAAPAQRSLPLQSIVGRDGAPTSVLSLLVTEARDAGATDVCIVVHPGDEDRYAAAVANVGSSAVHFVAQSAPRGYGHALWSAREFVGAEPFLHFVGDHIFLNSDPAAHISECIAQVAREADCAVSGIQPTRESLLPYFGTIGGQRVKGTQDRFVIERVIEKPTPTEAEQTLIVPGLRAGHYLCFMGTHVFTPTVLDLLDKNVSAANEDEDIPLSPVLDELAQREQYLAVNVHGRRFPLDMKYGLLMAQLALALSGADRDEVLSSLCDLLAQREIK